MLCNLKGEQVVFSKDSSDWSLSSDEQRRLAKELHYRIWKRPFHLEKGPDTSFSCVTADRTSINCIYNSEDSAYFDLVNDETGVAAFQISSWLYDSDDLYEITPWYGILFKSRATISVRLKKPMPPGNTDYLFIESRGGTHYRHRPMDSSLFWGVSDKHYAWVKVVFGVNEEQGLAIDAASLDENSGERYGHLKLE